jgi:hypothetical protein
VTLRELYNKFSRQAAAGLLVLVPLLGGALFFVAWLGAPVEFWPTNAADNRVGYCRGAFIPFTLTMTSQVEIGLSVVAPGESQPGTARGGVEWALMPLADFLAAQKRLGLWHGGRGSLVSAGAFGSLEEAEDFHGTSLPPGRYAFILRTASRLSGEVEVGFGLRINGRFPKAFSRSKRILPGDGVLTLEDWVLARDCASLEAWNFADSLGRAQMLDNGQARKVPSRSRIFYLTLGYCGEKAVRQVKEMDRQPGYTGFIARGGSCETF